MLFSCFLPFRAKECTNLDSFLISLFPFTIYIFFLIRKMQNFYIWKTIKENLINYSTKLGYALYLPCSLIYNLEKISLKIMILINNDILCSGGSRHSIIAKKHLLYFFQEVCNISRPVSYTHLDVYKRQVQYCRKPSPPVSDNGWWR